MQLEIKGKTYQVKFGTKFVTEMDKRHTMKDERGEFGMGLETTAPFLLARKITTLAEYLYVGTVTEKPRPSFDAVCDYLDEVEDIEAVFLEVEKELENSNASKLFIANLKRELEKEEA
ncbi:hypothetical protein HO609_02340 [Streptococcus suis]|uniref:tail assembly chaperone n=1 Tax=Streptococcus suis TaxID=1307 RepID=UPI0005CCA6BF|nr:tail assembly chaperone [Streptococcus suis]NQI41960.1 hypothetical protein [Streptococcus suis]CYU11973.1 phage protein [Streptococcus suis]